MSDGATPTYRTKTGRILTDAEIEALADEAERGYDVTHLPRARFSYFTNRERQILEEALQILTDWDEAVRRYAQEVLGETVESPERVEDAAVIARLLREARGEGLPGYDGVQAQGETENA